ncbi:MAG: right-handed parallel beta-helix repeat-containing protein [Bacteroidota bacterium]
MHTRAIAFLLVLISAFSYASADTEFFVSPGGNDQNPGTQQEPFRTLERARDAFREYRFEGGDPLDGATIWLMGGTHELIRTFEILGEDGGIEDAPIVYSAVEGEEVRLSGGRRIPADAFGAVTGQAATRRIQRKALPHILQADLKALGITDYGEIRRIGHGHPVSPAPLEVFWNDTVMQVARYPNKGGIPMGEVTEPGSVPRIGDYSKRPGRFLYTDPRHEAWAGAPEIWLQGYFHYGWSDDMIEVASIDTVKKEITLSAPHMYGLESGENFNEYIALNLLEELDAPGEFYVDQSTGKLFFWPPGDISSASIAVSLLEDPLIAIENASFVELRGLTLECGRGIGIYMEEGEHNRILDCVVRNVGTVGIMMGQGAHKTFPGPTADDYTGVPISRRVGSFTSHYYMNAVWDRKAGENHTIEGCEIYSTGSGGIILEGGSKKELIPGNSRVTDCRIHDFTRRNKAGAAGIIVGGCGNRVAHNEIYNGDLQAILARGPEHLYEYNHIHHVATNSNDASAWYTGRNPSDQGTVIRYNFFHHVGRPDRKWTMGVYFDDGICGALVEGNVFYRVASYGTVYSNGGHDIIVKNNIFIEGYGPAFQLKSMWYDIAVFQIPYYFGEDGIYTRRLMKDIDITKPPYSTKFPGLADWLDLLPDGKTYVGMRPRRNVFDSNVLVDYEETFRLVGKYAQCDFGENYITRDDPGFVDAEKMNFGLTENSVIYTALPGFKKIPFEKIGPRPKPAR